MTKNLDGKSVSSKFSRFWSITYAVHVSKTWLQVKCIAWVSLTLSKNIFTNVCLGKSLSNNGLRFVSWEHLEAISLMTLILVRAIDPELWSILYAAKDMVCNMAIKIKLSLSYLRPFDKVRMICEKINWKWDELWKSVIDIKN